MEEDVSTRTRFNESESLVGEAFDIAFCHPSSPIYVRTRNSGVLHRVAAAYRGVTRSTHRRTILNRYCLPQLAPLVHRLAFADFDEPFLLRPLASCPAHVGVWRTNADFFR